MELACIVGRGSCIDELRTCIGTYSLSEDVWTNRAFIGEIMGCVEREFLAMREVEICCLVRSFTFCCICGGYFIGAGEIY